MTTGINNISKFKDLSNGGSGVLIWPIFIGPVFYGTGTLMTLYLLCFRIKPEITENFIGIFFTFVFTFCYTLLILIDIYYTKKTIQKLHVKNDSLEGMLYFNRKFGFEFSAIESISTRHVSWLMSRSRNFPENSEGLEIVLKNQKRMLISPNIENFELLKKLIQQKVKYNNISLYNVQTSQNIYEDFSYDKNGKTINIVIMALILFAIASYGFGALSWQRYSLPEEELWGVVLFFFISMYYEIKMGARLFIFRNMIQRIEFDDDYLYLSLYFNRQVKYHVNEISSVSAFKVSILMAIDRTLIKGEEGVLLVMNNSKLYRISPKMQNIDDLRNRLSEFINK